MSSDFLRWAHRDPDEVDAIPAPKNDIRARLAADVDAFVANGGRVDVVPAGAGLDYTCAQCKNGSGHVYVDKRTTAHRTRHIRPKDATPRAWQ